MKSLSFVAFLAATTALVSAVQVHAQAVSSSRPQGAQLVSGAATVKQTGTNETTITQTSQQAILNWQSFSIDKGETVNVLQPGATSVLLNRVTGNTTSTIAGQLNANGQVFLINPNGIVIGKTGVVQAAGFVASTLDISDQDFLSGKLSFKASGPAAAVVHDGTIRIAQGGYAALLGGSVSATGTIIAPLGKVAIGAGSAATLDLSGDGFLQVAVAGDAGNGTALVSATDARDAVRQTVNTDAADAATSASGQDGHIVLSGRIDTSNGASGGDVKVLGGTLDLAGGVINAGNAHVETSGDTVNFTGVKVLAGDWLVDPTNLTIDSAAAATISSNLATTDVTLQTTASGASGPGVQSSGNGDITVTSAISWGSSHQLTLNAYHGISIDAPITVSGAGKVSLLTANGGDYDFGLGGNGFSGSLSFTGTPNSGQALTINGANYTLLYSMANLAGINNSGGNYALANTLQAGGTTYGDAIVKNFSGVFEGLGNTISSLTIVADNVGTVGLFGTSTGTVRDIGLVGGHVEGNWDVGSVTGNDQGVLNYAFSSASVSGVMFVGGLVGDLGTTYVGGNIYNSVATGDVSGHMYIGGLLGLIDVGGGGSNTVRGSSATGNITGDFSVGGLVGEVDSGVVTYDYATGKVTSLGNYNANTDWNRYYGGAGGLVGRMVGSISYSHATGAVSCAGTNCGGLVADISSGGVSYSYALGNVTGNGLRAV